MPTIKSQQAKRRRELCKANGLCTHCGQVPAASGWCEPCRQYHRNYGRNWRKANRANGKCLHCSKPATTHKLCEGCLYKKRKRAQRLKLAAFIAYGGPVCSCCGEPELVFLTIDHVNGGGNKHRKSLFGSPYTGGTKFYQWLKNQGYPPGFRVLCFNCNVAEARGGCPHRKRKEDSGATVPSGESIQAN